MDDALIRKFLDIFERDQDWERSRRHARRAGLMIVLNPHRDHDWVTKIVYDPEIFIRQFNTGFAWRIDFVERVLALDGVMNLEELPSVQERT